MNTIIGRADEPTAIYITYSIVPYVIVILGVAIIATIIWAIKKKHKK